MLHSLRKHIGELRSRMKRPVKLWPLKFQPVKKRKPVRGATRVASQQKKKRTLSLPKHWLKPVLIAAPILLLGGLLLNASQKMAGLPVGDVMVTGHSQNIEQQEIVMLVDELLGRGFWSLDLQAVKSSVEAHPWVRRAYVQRQWPDRLLIGVDEHVPVARWGTNRLLSATGKIFVVDSQQDFAHLPVFVAPDSEVYRVVEVFNYAQSMLDKHELSVVGLEGASSRRWSLLLDTGARIELGYWEDRNRLQRVNRLFDSFSREDIDRVSRIDLRYPNGLAVAWKTSSQLRSATAAVAGQEAGSKAKNKLQQG